MVPIPFLERSISPIRHSDCATPRQSSDISTTHDIKAVASKLEEKRGRSLTRKKVNSFQIPKPSFEEFFGRSTSNSRELTPTPTRVKLKYLNSPHSLSTTTILESKLEDSGISLTEADTRNASYLRYTSIKLIVIRFFATIYILLTSFLTACVPQFIRFNLKALNVKVSEVCRTYGNLIVDTLNSQHVQGMIQELYAAISKNFPSLASVIDLQSTYFKNSRWVDRSKFDQMIHETFTQLCPLAKIMASQNYFVKLAMIGTICWTLPVYLCLLIWIVWPFKVCRMTVRTLTK
ncbi:hypothetical protein BKA69DRAFT_868893 [Paraphysoderma sedebokerense]|nr:hypothetical protein BKA69DRAFT_868025 [Paraphysoderma sedebokerense]KAI9137769.1 hypothetical protein BKA69DRAFT_868893 [Paraphysoderma sedebokerense]